MWCCVFPVEFDHPFVCVFKSIDTHRFKFIHSYCYYYYYWNVSIQVNHVVSSVKNAKRKTIHSNWNQIQVFSNQLLYNVKAIILWTSHWILICIDVPVQIILRKKKHTHTILRHLIPTVLCFFFLYYYNSRMIYYRIYAKFIQLRNNCCGNDSIQSELKV